MLDFRARARARLRLLGSIALGLATVLFGTLGVLILVASTAWGEGSWIAAALLAAAAASGGALAGLLKQDGERWPE